MEKLEIFKGQQLTFTTPSGVPVTIREQSAQDDDLLSALSGNVQDRILGNMNKFIAQIVQENGFNNKNHLTVEEVENLKLKDKHYILLKSRIHSIGEDLDFEHICQNEDCNHKYPVSINLTKTFDADLSRPLKEQETTEYTITPYPKGTDSHFEITLSSGLRLRLEYLTGKGEIFMLRAFENKNITGNTELLARNLSYWDGQEWKLLKSLNVFSKRDSIEIRKQLKGIDEQFNGGVATTCPKCGNEAFLPFTTLPDFFFPA